MSEINARFSLNYPQFSLDVELSLADRGITALFGHSGSGKTSLLRCIAGLERAPTGELSVNGKLWQSEKFFLPTHKRPIGYVFQEASLLEHLTVNGNLRYAMKRACRRDNPISLEHAIELLGIEPLLQRHSHQLSGGERQRVAIARALLIQPSLLLMDEPLAALDLPRKLEILPYLERLKEELDLPIIYVSHAPDEVARLADYLVVMSEGKVIAQGLLSETLSRVDLPINLGEDVGVVIEGTIQERDDQWHLARVSFDGGDLWLRDSGIGVGSPVRIRVLARDISLAEQPHSDTSIANILPATISEIADDSQLGQALVRLKIGATHLIARITQRSAYRLRLQPGQQIWAQIKSVAII